MLTNPLRSEVDKNFIQNFISYLTKHTASQSQRQISYHGLRTAMLSGYSENHAMCINVRCGESEDFVMLMWLVHTRAVTAVVRVPRRVGRQHAKFTAFTDRKLQNVAFIQSRVHGLKCRYSYMAVC